HHQRCLAGVVQAGGKPDPIGGRPQVYRLTDVSGEVGGRQSAPQHHNGGGAGQGRYSLGRVLVLQPCQQAVADPRQGPQPQPDKGNHSDGLGRAPVAEQQQTQGHQGQRQGAAQGGNQGNGQLVDHRRKPRQPGCRRGVLGRLADGVGAIGVVPGVAFENHEYQQHKRADQRNKGNQQPPAAAAGVVQPAHRHCDTGEQYPEGVDGAEQPHPRLGVEAAGGVVDNCQSNTDQNIEQHEVPVLLAPGAAIEFSVFLENGDIPVHTGSLLVMLCPHQDSGGPQSAIHGSYPGVSTRV